MLIAPVVRGARRLPLGQRRPAGPPQRVEGVRHPRGLPAAVASAPVELAALFAAQVRALSNLGASAPSPEARARLLGARAGGHRAARARTGRTARAAAAPHRVLVRGVPERERSLPAGGDGAAAGDRARRLRRDPGGPGAGAERAARRARPRHRRGTGARAPARGARGPASPLAALPPPARRPAVGHGAAGDRGARDGTADGRHQRGHAARLPAPAPARSGGPGRLGGDPEPGRGRPAPRPRSRRPSPSCCPSRSAR